MLPLGDLVYITSRGQADTRLDFTRSHTSFARRMLKVFWGGSENCVLEIFLGPLLLNQVEKYADIYTSRVLGGLVNFDGSQTSLMFLMLLVGAYSMFRSCRLTMTF